jgi:3alpha(or 20beta)-hydroxysteroid dehydrogenase
MAGRVQDRVIVVTGAGRGQGAAELAALAAEGAQVIGVDLDIAGAPTVERTLLRELDVADPGGWEELAEFVTDRFGRLDGLIKNAGVTHSHRSVAPAGPRRSRR